MKVFPNLNMPRKTFSIDDPNVLQIITQIDRQFQTQKLQENYVLITSYLPYYHQDEILLNIFSSYIDAYHSLCDDTLDDESKMLIQHTFFEKHTKPETPDYIVALTTGSLYKIRKHKVRPRTSQAQVQEKSDSKQTREESIPKQQDDTDSKQTQ